MRRSAPRARRIGAIFLDKHHAARASAIADRGYVVENDRRAPAEPRRGRGDLGQDSAVS